MSLLFILHCVELAHAAGIEITNSNFGDLCYFHALKVEEPKPAVLPRYFRRSPDPEGHAHVKIRCLLQLVCMQHIEGHAITLVRFFDLNNMLPKPLRKLVGDLPDFSW